MAASDGIAVDAAGAPAPPAIQPKQHRIIRVLLWVLGIVALLYVVVLACFYRYQEKLIFRPDPLTADYVFTLPNVIETRIRVEGGVTLSGIHYQQPNAKGLVFFLHGNGGNVATWVNNTDFYRRTGYDLFMLDYRSYGKSGGRITSEEELHRDVRHTWRTIAPMYAGRKIIIFGRSLGTTFAAKLASEVKADWTVLVSPFYNLNALRTDIYPFVPASLMRYTFTTNEWLPHVKSPVTILHGDRDELINFTHATRLQALAPGTELLKIEGGSHGNMHHQPQYVEFLATRMAKL